jgi:antitoxin CptB
MNGAGEAGVERRRAQLAWRCRRGTRELDLLLLGWLERQYDGADEPQRERFAALLELPDPQLAAYLLGAERPSQAALSELIEAIRLPRSAVGAS